MLARIGSVVPAGFMCLTLIGAPPASAQTNAEIVQRVADEVWNQGNLAVADEIFAEDFVNHDPNPGGITDLEGYKRWARSLMSDRRGSILHTSPGHQAV